MEWFTYAIDFVLHINVHLAELLQNYGLWTYAILALIVFCETGLVVTPFLPGDSLLFASGALAAASDTDAFSPHYVVLLLWVSAVLGDAVNYHIGYFLGDKVFTSNSRLLNRKHLDRAHVFYEKHGGKTIVLARFVPILRTYAPFVAGIGKMSYWKFALYNVAGGLVWVASLTYLGFLFGNHPSIKSNFGLVVIAIIVISVLPIVHEFIKHRRQAKTVVAGQPK